MYTTHDEIDNYLDKDDKKVLEVGGGGPHVDKRYPRVNYIMDTFPPLVEPPDNVRYIVGSGGADSTYEGFTEKEFDFSICSHTIEDTHDLLDIVEKLSKFSKKGIIEIPSPLHEAKKSNSPFGDSHHHWIIKIMSREEAREYQFLEPYKKAGDDIPWDVPYVIAAFPKLYLYNFNNLKLKIKPPFNFKYTRQRMDKYFKRYHLPHFLQEIIKKIYYPQDYSDVFFDTLIWHGEVHAAVLHPGLNPDMTGKKDITWYMKTFQKWCDQVDYYKEKKSY